MTQQNHSVMIFGQSGRQSGAIQIIRNRNQLPSLTYEDLVNLYRIVINEAENWDGEFVSEEFVANQMIKRFERVGLIPSRN